ncbi:MAG: aspartyl/asparaginyl beta-hydroxylase domain-containing protein, partial [Thermoanaerobaculia bacterium]
MKLSSEFIRLPLRFDVSRLTEEVNQFAENAWRPHPQGYPGNTALPLISAHGDPANDQTKGPMRPTAYLEACPYVRQVLASFGSAI